MTRKPYERPEPDAEVSGSPDAGLAPEWPVDPPEEESSAVKDERVAQSSDGANTGHKTSE
jgi:hypothetical protein